MKTTKKGCNVNLWNAFNIVYEKNTVEDNKLTQDTWLT